MQLPDLPLRMRRLRGSAALRNLVRETTLSAHDLIYPIFVDEAIDEPKPVASMPGVCRLPLSAVAAVAREVAALEIPGLMLFGIPADKDAVGSSGWDGDGIVQRAIAEAKSAAPELAIIPDTCFCEYTSHGHCGVLDGERLLNDATLENLQLEALSYARAGADMVAPSGMMDGMVAAIRAALDSESFHHIPILSYAVKYASAWYGPFREAADASPSFGDRASYQMDPANGREAMREAALDLAEGADILMVKPGLAYMDVLHQLSTQFDCPLAIYSVSGEYAMIKQAAANGWVDERRVVMETMVGFKRAGATIILSYFALDVARWLRDS
ncbi:MAG: porphobilinogen synthase [Mariprofundales bacterium]|nr:porphobilinogen synthase [Mariprofundales bacterium]